MKIIHFLLYLRWKSGVTFVRRYFRDENVIAFNFILITFLKLLHVMNYIAKKTVINNYFKLLSISFVISSVVSVNQYFSMLMLKGSGDYGFIF